MVIELTRPDVADLAEVDAALRAWQHDDAPVQLHPGDLGWFWRHGPAATAAALRVWRRDGRPVAVGLRDGPGLLRWATDPELLHDEAAARRVLADVADPARDVLPAGRVAVETPNGARLAELLDEQGWQQDAPWALLRRDLTEPVPDPGLRVEVVGPDRVAVHAAVLRSAFGRSTFTFDRAQATAAGLPHRHARSLLAFDAAGAAVAAVTVWSAGPGRPGVLEPMGVHAEHRGRGHGRAISRAAAAALRALGASSAVVCAETGNAGAVAAYRSAGFELVAERRDRVRAA